jgi:chitin disaccharide deacetylase
MTRTIAFCADDFGLDPAVCAGILALARRGRLSAVSCLSGAPAWRAWAPELAALPRAVARGLHFNLTEGAPLSPELRRRWPVLPGLPRLIAHAHLGRLPLRELAAEWHAQWAAFVDATGVAPDFADGHQHVHHLPGIREIVLDAAGRARLAVRNTGQVRGPGFALKRWLIEHTGGRALRAALRQRAIAHNRVLLGVYDFRAPDYRGLVQRWLAAAPDHGALLFCHPAAAGSGDPIAPARCREAAYLGSADFPADLAAAGFTLGAAWPETSSAG